MNIVQDLLHGSEVASQPRQSPPALYTNPGRVLRNREEQLVFGGKDEQLINDEAQTGPQGLPALPVLSRYAAGYCRMGTGTIR